MIIFSIKLRFEIGLLLFQTEGPTLLFFRRGLTHAVFQDLAKVAFKRSKKRKKLVGKESKQRADEFRFLIISSRVFTPMGPNVDNLMKLLLCRCSTVRGQTFGVDVLLASLIFLIFLNKKKLLLLHALQQLAMLIFMVQARLYRLFILPLSLSSNAFSSSSL